MFNKLLIFLLGAALFAIQVEDVSAKLHKLRQIQPHLKIKPAKINPLDLIDEGHKIFDEFEQQASWDYNVALAAIDAGLNGFNITADSTFNTSVQTVEVEGVILLSDMDAIWWDNENAGKDISSCYDPSREKLINYINQTMDSMVNCMNKRIKNTNDDLLDAEEDVKRVYSVIVNLRKAFDRCRDDKCRQDILDEVSFLRNFLPSLMDEIAGLATLNLVHDVNLFEICLSKGLTQIMDGNDIIDELQACVDNLPL